jgi:hypothetical protein
LAQVTSHSREFSLSRVDLAKVVVDVCLWKKQASQLEAVARTHYMGDGDEKDPVACSLFYFALRKRRLMQTLWKQAMGHPERTNMTKFLQNNFEDPRWRTAALKNAYVLLSKRRFREFALAESLGVFH